MSRGGYRKNAGRPKGKGKFGEATKPVRIPVSMVGEVLSFVQHKGYQLPLYSSKVQAGFPSPADDHAEGRLDLNEHLIKHPAATFFVRVTGESMINAGIHPDDILVVDRSLDPSHGRVVIAAVNGELTVKRLHKLNGEIMLIAENEHFPPIHINEGEELLIWGVVTNVIHNV